VLEGRKPPGFAGLGKDLLHLAIFIREPEMAGSENDDHTSWMRVQRRFLVRPIVDVYYLHVLIFESQPVVGWLDFDGILRKHDGGEIQA
jgi:hypothetical protein